MHSGCGFVDDGIGNDCRQPTACAAPTCPATAQRLSRPPRFASVDGPCSTMPCRRPPRSRPTFEAQRRMRCGHGVAAYPVAWLVRRRRLKASDGRACRDRQLAGRELAAAARSRNSGFERDRSLLLRRRHRRAHHHRRTQHVGRGFCADRRMGPFRNGRRRDARPGPHRRARLHVGRTRRLGRHSRYLPSAETTFDVYLNARSVLGVTFPRCRLVLQARRLSGPQEMAVVSRA